MVYDRGRGIYCKELEAFLEREGIEPRQEKEGLIECFYRAPKVVDTGFRPREDE